MYFKMPFRTIVKCFFVLFIITGCASNEAVVIDSPKVAPPSVTEIKKEQPEKEVIIVEEHSPKEETLQAADAAETQDSPAQAP